MMHSSWVALTPRLENRSLRIHWFATLNHYVAKVQVRVNGKLLGTQIWPRETRTRGGAFDLPVNLPLWEPCHVQLTAQVWNQNTGTRQLESVTVGTEDLRAARIVAGNPQLVMDSRKGTAVLSLSPNRPWVQVEVGASHRSTWVTRLTRFGTTSRGRISACRIVACSINLKYLA